MNDGIEQAYRDGILSTASLMVAGDAAMDAVRRARAMPGLRVGLHVVAIEGPVMSPPDEVAALLDGEGRIPSDQLGLGLRYAFNARTRAALQREILAQFRAFMGSGLALDHANAHKHMHLHPVVGQMMIAAGQGHRLRAMRIPAEPATTMVGLGMPQGIGARALLAWTNLLRAQARRARLVTNDHAFGIAWSGHMTEDKLLGLIPRLPPGLSEIYFHPAAGRDAVLDRFMPDYEHQGELAALLSPVVRAAFDTAAIPRTTWGEEAETRLSR